jgi:alkylation response protein AidB-like acyl-CoA dehydrogenase
VAARRADWQPEKFRVPAMSIDFTLTAAQQKLQRNAREFSVEILQPLVKKADEERDTQKAFVLMKGAYLECYKLGFATGFLPREYGGGGISNLDLQIVAEEITAVDPGFATVLLAGLLSFSRHGNESVEVECIPKHGDGHVDNVA